MKRVLVISVDPAEATHRLRIGILPDLLANEGFEFDFHPRPADFWRRRKLIATAGNYHAVILQRKLLDPSHARLLRRVARKVFFDVDDAVMVQRREIGRISGWLKRRRYIATAAAVNQVVAGNEYLADEFRKLGCTVTVLPTVVDPAHYLLKQHMPTEQPALVWIGSRSTRPYLQECLPALETAARLVPGLRLIAIADAPVQSASLPIENISWTLNGEAAALARGDIGIAPTPTDRWSIGKSGFKIIQYMAAGLPTIASPVGANSQILSNGITGLLPASWDQWPDAIAELAKDHALRHRMGHAARQTVERDFSLQRAKKVWLQLLRQ